MGQADRKGAPKGSPTAGEALTPQGLLEVGVVVKPHGVRGEVKVRLHWEGSDSLQCGRRVLLRRGPTPGAVVAGEARLEPEEVTTEVEGIRRAGRFVVARLRSVATPEGADALRGYRLYVRRSDLPELEEGEYYLSDLVGATVRGPEGPVGVVKAVRPYPTLDVLVIAMADGRLVEQPLGDAWVEAVDVVLGEVLLRSLDGLVE